MRTFLQSLLLLAFLVTFLSFFSPPAIYANSVEQSKEPLHEQKLLPKPPQTPEELLLVFKELFRNPDVDGHDFCEQWLGLNRLLWKSFESNQQRGLIAYKKIVGSMKNVPAAPYQLQEVRLDRQFKVEDLSMYFYENPTFLMTPALTKKILGPPESIFVSSPKSEYSSGRYQLTYQYVRGTYRLWIDFMDKKEIVRDKKMRRAYKRHLPERIESERANRILFENHKDYLPFTLKLER